MKARILHLFIFLNLLSFLWIPFTFAIELGGESGTEENPLYVEVTGDNPVAITETPIGELIELAEAVSLDFEREYQTDYVDVSDYRHAAFYVIPEKTFQEPDTPVLYQLDAYFAAEMTPTSYKKFGEKDDLNLKAGHHEFGSMLVRGNNDETLANFAKLSTGPTATRILTTPIYGPYVYVILKSLTPEDGRRFRIVAYLSR